MTAYPHQPGLSRSAEPSPGCQAGDRIALVHTADPYTRLTPGTAGTVTGYDDRLGQLAVAWDDGSTLSMLLRDGDQVRLITPAAPGAVEDPAPPARQARPGQNPAGGSPPPASPAPCHPSPEGEPSMPPVPAPGGPARPAPSLRQLAEAVRCHVPVQPDSRHGTDPVPAGIFYGPLLDGTGGQRCDWSVRFVTGLSPGGRARRWGWARGRTLASALQAARDIQRAAAVPPPAGSPPHSTPRGEERNTP